MLADGFTHAGLSLAYGLSEGPGGMTSIPSSAALLRVATASGCCRKHSCEQCTQQTQGAWQIEPGMVHSGGERQPVGAAANKTGWTHGTHVNA